jgi:hypothetical protein
MEFESTHNKKTRWWTRWGFWVALAFFLGVPLLSSILWRPSRKEKADEAAYVDCEDKILTAWATQDTAHVRERLELVDKYVFGWAFSGFSEYDISKLKSAFHWDDRTQAARKIGVTEAELIALDQKILRECGRPPEYTDKFPFGRKRIK